MRRMLSSLLAGACLLTPGAPSVAMPSRGEKPWIIAHRGAWAHAPENTIYSFRKALRLGATMLELDVRLTGPDRRGIRVPIAFHDPKLDRATDCSGLVRTTPWDEIRTCDAGFGTMRRGDTRFVGRGIRVPTIARVLATFPRTPLILDVKPRAERLGDASDTVETVAALVTVLQQRARRDERVFDRVLVASFGNEVLSLARTLEPRVRTALLTRPPGETLMGSVARSVLGGNDVAVPSIRAGDLREETVAAITRAGHTVYVHTADDPARIRTLARWGVDGIYTNHPARVARALRHPFSSSRACSTSICI